MTGTDVLHTPAGIARQNILMRSVYAWMMFGPLVSGVTVYVVGHSQALESVIFGNRYGDRR